MKDYFTHIRHVIFLFAAILLLTGCSRNRYTPVSDNFNDLLKGRTALDTLFVKTIAAPTAAEFDSGVVRFMAAYARDFDDLGITRFSPLTPYAARQDSLFFFMQDYLLNTFRYDESIELGRRLDQRLSTEKPSNAPLRSASLGDIGVAFFYLGNLEEAIKYQRIGYELDLQLGDPQLISSDLNQLAAMCLRSEKYDLARDYIIDAISAEVPLNRSATLAIRYGLASEIYLKLKDYATAADYARKALELDSRDGRENKVGIRLSQLAAIQIAQNDDAAAEESLAEAIPLLKANNNINSLAIANCQLGELALRKADNTRAQQSFYEALLLCRSAGIKPIEKRALHGLWLAMKDTNPALGADYLENYSALSDSLNTASIDSQLANMKAEFATRELRLDNERLEARNRINRIIIICAAVLLLLLCLAGWLFFRYRSSRQNLMHHMEQMRLNFFSNITHEFRTPLTIILGLSAELEKNDDVQRQASIISQEGQNLLALVNQLLDIGKISSSAGHAEWRHGNVIGYLNMLIESLRPLAVSHNTEMVFAPEANVVEMDFVPDYLRKIVVNIITNSLKYTNGDGRVLIAARTDNSRLILRFADNGSGIDPADLENIFKPFYQGTNSKTTVGTGVGLSLVKLLVEAMDGDITVKSSRGIGTIFILSLPLRQSNPEALVEPLDTSDTSTIPAATVAETSDSRPDDVADDNAQQRPSVLIVEDNVNVSDYMASILADRYNIFTATNGEEGLNKALNIIPDLIISDIMMPVMDGVEMLKKLRRSDILSHLPVVMVTARATDADRIEGVNAGADAYINKPFNAAELRAVAMRLIEQRRLLCEKYRLMDVQVATSSGTAPDDEANDRAFIGRLINVVYHLISKRQPTDTTVIAARMNTSERSLARKLQALTGESTVAFVNRVKIDKAKRILDSDNTSPLADIATRSGFDDPAYFSRIFKQTVGVSPTTYRRLRTRS